MKKTVKKIGQTAAVVLIALTLLFAAALTLKPFGDLFFSFCFGSCYACVGEAVL